MSSHPRSGGPPSLMDDVPDFDRNFHSHRFDGNREGGRGRGGANGGPGGMRGRGGDGGFGHRAGHRGGGRGDFHQRDRFHHGHNFNRSDDDQHGGPPKMPNLFDVNQHPPRPFDREHGGGGRGRMPYQRGGAQAGRDGLHDARYRQSGPRSTSTDGPPSLLDLPSEKPPLLSNNPVPSLLSVRVENPGNASLADANKSVDSHKDQHHSDVSYERSEHQSHRDSDNRHRERDSRKSHQSGSDRSSSYNRDRSRSPRDRDRDRHSSSRDDRSFGGDHRRMGHNGGRGGRGGDHYGRGGGTRGGHQNPRDSQQSRFGPDQSQAPWQDRREGARPHGGRGNFHDHPRDMGGHHRSNEQLPPDNHPYHRDGRPNFDGPLSSQNRSFQEGGFPSGNFDQMGPAGQNRSNFHQGHSLTNRPDFYRSNNQSNNSGYPPHNTRSGGRPSRFSDRQDEYEDERPLTKPNLPLPNIPTTTPLYLNQPNNPTFSQPRQPLASAFSSQQTPLNMFPHSGPGHGQPPTSQFPWVNQQMPSVPNSHMNPPLTHTGSSNQPNSFMSTTGSTSNLYGSNADFHRQSASNNTNPYYSDQNSLASQNPNKPPTVNAQNSATVAAAATNPATAANINNTEAWHQYCQYWQALQQHQQVGANSLASYPWLNQAQTASLPTASAAVKPPGTGNNSNPQDPSTSQGNAEAWAQYYYLQYQAYLQQQQAQMANTATSLPNGSATITAPSQLYSKSTGKP